MSDTVLDGSQAVDLGSGAPIEPLVEEPIGGPVTEEQVATGDAAAIQDSLSVAPEPEDEPAAEAKPPQDAARAGLIRELKTIREERRQLQGQLDAVRPLLERITPDLHKAIVEGRISVTKEERQAIDADRERLAKVAARLRLPKVENAETGELEPDYDGARRVVDLMKEVVNEELAPERQDKTRGVAEQNVSQALAFARDNGYDVDTVEQVYREAAQRPNGLLILNDPEACKDLWYKAVGLAESSGKGRKAKPADASSAPASEPGKAPILADATGRRRTNGVSLNPKIQKVYRDGGLDPNKTFSSKVTSFDQPIDLE